MPDDLNGLWIVLSILTAVFAAGGAWFVNKATLSALEAKSETTAEMLEEKLNTAVGGFGKSVDLLVAEMREDREDQRTWLKSLETRVGQHATEIAVLKDREGRGAA